MDIGKMFTIHLILFPFRLNSDLNLYTPLYEVRRGKKKKKKIVNQTYHLKFNFQLKPPHVISEAVMYSNVSSDITSIIGHTTVFLQSKNQY